MNRFLKMNESDTVATALIYLKAGERANIYSVENLPIFELIAVDDIPFGNKIALVDIFKGDKVIKYGSEIGESTSNIRRGELVHVHNVKSMCVDIPPAFKQEIMRQMNIAQKEGVLNDV